MRTIDFLPDSYRESRRRRTVRIRRLWLAGMVLAGLACWFAVGEVRLRGVRAQLAYIAQQHKTTLAGLEHIARLQAEQAVLLDRHRLVQELQSPVSSVETMFRIARLLPENVALRQLQVACQPASTLAKGSVETAAAAVAAAVAAVTGAKGAQVKAEQAVPVMVPHVMLSGLAASQVDIAVLVGQLSGCREFANVRLDYSKAADFDGRRAQEFRVTFDVTPPAPATQQTGRERPLFGAAAAASGA